MTDTLETVREVVRRQIDREMIEDFDDIPLQELGADSIDHVEIMLELEGKFDIETTDDELEHAKTMREVAALIDGKLNAKEKADV